MPSQTGIFPDINLLVQLHSPPSNEQTKSADNRKMASRVDRVKQIECRGCLPGSAFDAMDIQAYCLRDELLMINEWYDRGQVYSRFHAYEFRRSPRKDSITTTYCNTYCLGLRRLPWAYTKRYRMVIGFVLPRKQEL